MSLLSLCPRSKLNGYNQWYYYLRIWRMSKTNRLKESWSLVVTLNTHSTYSHDWLLLLPSAKLVSRDFIWSQRLLYLYNTGIDMEHHIEAANIVYVSFNLFDREEYCSVSVMELLLTSSKFWIFWPKFTQVSAPWLYNSALKFLKNNNSLQIFCNNNYFCFKFRFYQVSVNNIV